jgi:hypothetical protein
METAGKDLYYGRLYLAGGQQIGKIRLYAISCSSMVELNVTKLFVWGGSPYCCWLPQTEEEALKQINACRKKHKCIYCDAEIHIVEVDRTRKTYKQYLTGPDE